MRYLGTALIMYTEDWGALPQCTHANELVGVDYQKLEEYRQMPRRDRPAKPPLRGGAIWPYLKNQGIFFCPSDPWNLDWRGRLIFDRFPEPGISCTWNAAVAGKKLEDLPPDTWLLRDRQPWHFGGWNVVQADGTADWQRPPRR